jgi:hypothetical protein
LLLLAVLVVQVVVLGAVVAFALLANHCPGAS